jgi:predicted transcriptional regulator
MTAGELCNRNVIIICENESVLEAARPIKKYHVGCLVVVQELTDLAQLV